LIHQVETNILPLLFALTLSIQNILAVAQDPGEKALNREADITSQYLRYSLLWVELSSNTGHPPFCTL
jgi:hypothetical protein